MDFAGIGIIYNKDIFAKYGLKAPTTYRDLQRVCDLLQTNGVTPFAGLLKENWSMGHFITMVQTTLLAEKGIDATRFVADMNAGKTSYGCVDTTKLFTIMDFYRANMDKDAQEMGWDQQQAEFANGKAAMMVQGLWSYGAAIGTNPKLKCGFVPFPGLQRGEDEQVLRRCGLLLRRFLPVLAREARRCPQVPGMAFHAQGQQIWVKDYKLTSTFRGADVSALGGPFVDLMSTVSKNGSYPWAFAAYPTAVFEDACKNGAQQYMFGKKSADDVISDIDKEWAAEVAKTSGS